MQKENQSSGSFKSIFAAIVIPAAILAAILIYMFILGNPSNFQGGDPNNHPLPGNYLGIVYKGGAIVPLLLSTLIIVLTFAIERFLTISRSKGKGSMDNFMRRI